MHEKLFFTIRQYAATTENTAPIEHNDNFTDQNGEVYTTWTPHLLQAAYNHEYTEKDLSGYSHNPKYILEDSIDDLGEDTRGMNLT